MNLNSFEAVLNAATEVTLQGESLILVGEGKTLALHTSSATSWQEVCVICLDGPVKAERVITRDNFNAKEFVGMEVPPLFRRFLIEGEKHGS